MTMFPGLMQDWPLTINHFLDRARRIYHRKTIVTKTVTGMHRETYEEFGNRVERLAAALAGLGVRPGARVATFAWNSFRHLEVYFAAPCMGAVLHTVNIRLFPEQIVFICNHAEDEVAFVDASVWPLFEKLRPHLKTIRHVIVMPDVPMPALPPGTIDYEALLAAAPASFPWPRLDENSAAGMCYTSGTTGNPKGVVYSHRAIVLHSLVQAQSDLLAVNERDVCLSIVPMFHVNAWGLPFTGTMIGATQVYPSHFMTPKDLLGLIEQERVTFVGGVPTIVGAMYQQLKQQPVDVSSLRSVAIGGSALPQSLMLGFERDFGVKLVHAWGMTETTPVGTICNLKSNMDGLSPGEQLAIRLKQGLPVPCVEVRVVDEAGTELPWDGKSAGELQVRGPWIIREYYNDPRSAECFMDGWFRTGDVANIDAEGYVQLVDRTKDMVKSGGEWISSVDLENAIMGHPKVAEAAVIAVAHPKWTERPMACVVARDPSLTRDEVRHFLKGKVADWWLPDDVVFIESVPKTSVGKFDKKALRERFKDHKLPH
ncbi:MAG TPA: long-chain fatty acid--CoA ligase [Gemmatimonadales bacterium]